LFIFSSKSLSSCSTMSARRLSTSSLEWNPMYVAFPLFSSRLSRSQLTLCVQTITSTLLALLLHDVDILLRPLPVSPLSPTSSNSLTSHPFSQPLTALSDLYNLFSTSPPTPTPPKPTLIARPSATSSQPKRDYTSAAQKLLFYVAFLASRHSPVNSQVMGGIAGRIGREAERREREAREAEEGIRVRRAERQEGRKEGVEETGKGKERPKIVELV
jgi:hypothetical protein